MTPVSHPELTEGRWFSMTLAEQMGNIGSEYGRARSWKNRKHPEYFQKAFDRMLELMDLTLSDPRWRNHRLGELTRVRETAAQLGEPSDTVEDLSGYFLQFALLARKNSVGA
ncbi:MAG: hypothetical protein ACREL1_04750 [bacterium]